MRKITLFILVLTSAVTFTALAGSGTAEVSTTATKILGSPSRKGGQIWVASTAYVQGEVVMVGRIPYMALVAGTTSTTVPSGRADFTDGTVVWRHALNVRRDGLFIGNEGAEQVTINWVKPSGDGDGITLASGEKVLFAGSDTPQVAVYALAAVGTNSVSVLEW
jgi:hypothetical protein